MIHDLSINFCDKGNEFRSNLSRSNFVARYVRYLCIKCELRSKVSINKKTEFVMPVFGRHFVKKIL